jgi:hypothetical protein
LLQDSVNAASGFQNCIAKIRRFLLYGLFAVAAYVIKNAVEEKKREHRLLRYPLL